MATKGVLLSRRPCACRNGLPHVVSIVGQLVEALKELGPDAVVDMDAAAQRESLVRAPRCGSQASQ